MVSKIRTIDRQRDDDGECLKVKSNLNVDGLSL